MGSLENVLFHALSGIIVSRTKLCLYVVKGQDILNVIELLKHNQTIDVSSNCVFREETTHTHRNKPNSIHHVISNYVLHMHLLSCPNMVFLIVNHLFPGALFLFGECHVYLHTCQVSDSVIIVILSQL